MNVLRNSTRLLRNKKIACITYTNVGVDTIKKRLNESDENIEISTIHSFLYKHIGVIINCWTQMFRLV